MCWYTFWRDPEMRYRRAAWFGSMSTGEFQILNKNQYTKLKINVLPKCMLLYSSSNNRCNLHSGAKCGKETRDFTLSNKWRPPP